MPLKGTLRIWSSPYVDKRLTENSGARAYAWYPYLDDQNWRLWNTIAASYPRESQDRIRVRELKDLTVCWGTFLVHDDESGYPDEPDPCIAISPLPRKHVAWLQQNPQTGLDEVMAGWQELTGHHDEWHNVQVVSLHGINDDGPAMSIAAQSSGGANYVNMAYTDYTEGDPAHKALLCAHSTDAGVTFDTHTIQVAQPDEFYLQNPSLAPAAPNSATLYCVAHKETYGGDNPAEDSIFCYKSTDGGATWPSINKKLIASYRWRCRCYEMVIFNMIFIICYRSIHRETNTRICKDRQKKPRSR